MYKADSLAGFEEKMRGILEKRLPDLTEAGYQIAQDRCIEAVGEKLRSIYLETIERVNQNKK